MYFGRLPVVLLLTAALAAPAAAQESMGDDIVVTGLKRPSATQAESFVRRLVPTDAGQLARFLDPVCPLILGMPASQASAIDDRLRRVAAAHGVEVAQVPCEPNLVLAVAANADGLIKTMRKRHSYFFNDLSDVDLRDAFRSGEVHAWRLVEDRGETGAPISGGARMAESQSSSVFSLSTQAAAVNAVVVFDKQIVLDKTIAQIADYAAMRALTGARPPDGGETADDTIVSLFSRTGREPKGLTVMDQRLLASLYAMEATGTASMQVHRLSRHMAGEAVPER